MLGPVFPKRVISKWPAIILAVNRTAKVPGRIILLIVSMQTINGIKILGVPWGTKWQNMCWVLLNHPYNINAIHRGILNIRVKVKWLDLVKIYGNNPKKLLNKIIVNKLIKIKLLPLKPLFPIKILNSLWRVKIKFFHKYSIRVGINQNVIGIIVTPMNELSQLIGDEKIEEQGSKTENKFVIIFNLFLIYERNFFLYKKFYN